MPKKNTSQSQRIVDYCCLVKKITFYSENHMEHRNVTSGQNAEILS